MRYTTILIPLLLLLRPAPATETVYLPLIMSPSAPIGKAGVVWPDNANEDTAALLNADWWYDYNVRIDGPQIGNMQFVPYIWCDQWPPHSYDNQTTYYFDVAAAHGMDEHYRGYLLFLNEPDLPGSDTGGQCDMTPRQAAYLYKAIKRKYPHAILVGPSVSHRDYWRGWIWLREWYDLIIEMGLPPPEVAAIHTYLDEPPHLIVDSLFRALAEYPGAPQTAWVTEFGHCDPAVAGAMIDAWQADARIERYAWFIVQDWQWPECLNLLGRDGELTPVGDAWADRHVGGK